MRRSTGRTSEEHDAGAARLAADASEGWTIVVVRKENLFGRDQDIDQLLRAGAKRGRARLK